MKPNKPSLFFISLILASLACTFYTGGPDYSDLTPIPVSTEAAQSLQDGIKKSIEDGLVTGVVTMTITEPQITSYLALRLQSDPSLQQENSTPLITDPQVYLRDGQMKIYGKTQQGMFAANIGIIVNVGVDAEGKPKIEIASADFGPFPAPEGINETITAIIADGIMTIIGRIR